MPLVLASLSGRSTACKKWDTEMLAYVGALPSTALGCLYEVYESLSRDLSEIESFAVILGEITAAALVGAALFAAVAAIRNWRLAS